MQNLPFLFLLFRTIGAGIGPMGVCRMGGCYDPPRVPELRGLGEVLLPYRVLPRRLAPWSQTS